MIYKVLTALKEADSSLICHQVYFRQFCQPFGMLKNKDDSSSGLMVMKIDNDCYIDLTITVENTCTFLYAWKNLKF